MLEKVTVLQKSNAEKEDQIAELSNQLVDRYSDLDKQEKEATDALKSALEKVEFLKQKAERQWKVIREFKVMAGNFGANCRAMMSLVDKMNNLEEKDEN